MIYDYSALGGSISSRLDRSVFGGVWNYRRLLPLDHAENITTLGEGGTPLLHLRSLSDRLGLPALYLKNEATNPTWSFKDRANAVAISVARELGFKKVAVASTGNHGCSAAAYCAASGLECVVFCHEEISPVLLNMIHHYGARAVVGGPRAFLLSTLVREEKWFPSATIVPLPEICSPYGVEGFKTIAYEIFEELGAVPDCVFVPVASGDGLYGIWKGFRELEILGLARKLPRMYGCQAQGCNPLVRSFQAGLTESLTISNPHSMALSIREPTTGPLGLRAVCESAGQAVDCSESAIEEAWRMLADHGMFVEAASAVPVACARKLVKAGRLRATDTVICVLTGAGTKWAELPAARPAIRPLRGAEILDPETLVKVLTRDPAGQV